MPEKSQKLPKQEHAEEPLAGVLSLEQVEACYNEALAMEAEGQNPYPGSTYVAGVRATIAWVLGESDDAPLEW